MQLSTVTPIVTPETPMVTRASGPVYAATPGVPVVVTKGGVSVSVTLPEGSTETSIYLDLQ